MEAKNFPSGTEQSIEDLTASDVTELKLGSSGMRITTEDASEWVYALGNFRNHVRVLLNGMEIRSMPGGTWQPTLTVTRVEKLEINVETAEETGEDHDGWFVTIEGSGEFSP